MPRRRAAGRETRDAFITGRGKIAAFLARTWAREFDYRLIKEVWGFRENRMAFRFAYERHNAAGQWFRPSGNELWEFDADVLTRRRIASIKDTAISEPERRDHWPPGRRPDDHPALSQLGL